MAADQTNSDDQSLAPITSSMHLSNETIRLARPI